MPKIPESIAEHRTNVLPLRWFANLCGALVSRTLLRMIHAEEHGNRKGIVYRFDSFVWDKLFKIYTKYGTTYKLYGGLNSDYDANGVPYWERTGTIDPDYITNDDYNDDCMSCCANLDGRHCTGCMICDNDFLDEETGDAFRVIRKEIK